jgi:hypothetical protein
VQILRENHPRVEDVLFIAQGIDIRLWERRSEVPETHYIKTRKYCGKPKAINHP